jgi:phosphoribosylformylglycinamidine synthase
MVKPTLEANPNNSVIAFRDNSSAIRGLPTIRRWCPSGRASPRRCHRRARATTSIFTAETHNFPSGVAPFPGAETGTGGRIRDVHATGRGSLVVAGHRRLLRRQPADPGYELPWEDPFRYPPNLASPLEIEIEASNGASDYGNKFGEPVIQGFTRSFGLRLPNGERREWIKPIMFSGGIGQIDDRHTAKGGARTGMLGGQDRRARLPHRHGRRRRLEHGPGRERGRARLQRRAARRRRDGAEGQPRHPRLRGAG